jgi:hypothetical protein
MTTFCEVVVGGGGGVSSKINISGCHPASGMKGMLPISNESRDLHFCLKTRTTHVLFAYISLARLQRQGRLSASTVYRKEKLSIQTRIISSL